MAVFLALVVFSTLAAAHQHCETPTGQPGECVLISHCPHLFRKILQNQTNSHVRSSHCGFESLFFPKVCCPVEAVKLFQQAGAISHTKYATKCGLHEPDGPDDPWLALMEYERDDGERDFICGGVLISKRYVLTAAHCVKGANVTLRNVRLGSLVIPVDGSTAHEDYQPDDPNQYHDIALVRLKHKVSFKEGLVRPICVPMEKRGLLGATLSLTGWDKVGNTSTKRDGIVTVRNNVECHLVYNVNKVKLRESQVCVDGRILPYRRPVRLDVGGFLMHVSNDTSYSVVGVMSLGPPCCDKEDYPKVYTKVASYVDWIMNNLKP
jgi:hypothetical protein